MQDEINWDYITKEITYQLRDDRGWVSIPRSTYCLIAHAENRRVLVKSTRTTFNTLLMEIPK